MAEKAAEAFALGTDLVEFRLDRLRTSSPNDINELAHLARRSIITVRRKEEGGGFEGGEEERLSLISGATKIRPLYIDVELRTAEENPVWYSDLPRSSRKIVSWHDFKGTPAFPRMRRLRDRASAIGDVAKIVATAKTTDDNLTVLRLYDEYPRGLVAFCMGSLGLMSRLVGMSLGSPIIYASLPNEEVAPGQLSVSTVVGLKKMWERLSW